MALATPDEVGNRGELLQFDFFVVGGTLKSEAPSYVKRRADDSLYAQALAGEFSYILTPRQMGKSSLMVRTAKRLKAAGIRTAIVDLTQIGTDITAEQWYVGILARLSSELHLSVDPQDWWGRHSGLGLVHRFSEFLREVVLLEIKEPLVIFVDEIDTTLKLDFSDDFFAAIRAMYNARAVDPAYERLTFVLLGVAAPADLIKDRELTPFNIGQAVDLREFTKQDAEVLEQALEVIFPGQASAVFDRIFDWTSGHPYLTQKLCYSVAISADKNWSDQAIDDLTTSLFLSEEAKRETNLQFVRDSIANSHRRRRLLKLYRRVYEGEPVAENERSLSQSQLKLYGLVKSVNGSLQVSNKLYCDAFNKEWIEANTPVDWTRRIAVASVIVVILLIVAVFLIVRQQPQQTKEALAQVYEQDFRDTSNPTLRLGSLGNLFELEGFEPQGRTLFYDLPLEERTSLFTGDLKGLQSQVRVVVEGTHAGLANTEDNGILLRNMMDALEQSTEAESRLLANELAQWLEGREAFAQDEYGLALDSYSDAIDLSDSNPAIFYDRGVAYVAIGDYRSALEDFNAALSLELDPDIAITWQDNISIIILGNRELYAIWFRDRGGLPALSAILPTPTNTPTPTSTNTPSPRVTETRAELILTPSETPTRTPSPTILATVPSATPTTPNPSPTATFVRLTPTPTNTPVPLPTNTPVPQPTNTPKPPPTNTQPPPTNTQPPPTNTQPPPTNTQPPPTRPPTPTPT